MSNEVEDRILEEIRESDKVTVPTTIIEHYDRLQLLIESIKSDAIKASRGNKSASTRLRKSLRLVKKTSAEFVKFSLGKS
tara:strand:- start:261 stop:500 length:240 start_codon:yes stop_codon:yes gene_type:complete